MINGLDHVNFRTRELEKLVEFYTSVLGLVEGERPPFSNPGAWLYADSRALIHISVSDDEHGASTLPIDHIALQATGIEQTVDALVKAGVHFEVDEVPGRRMRQVFFDDPQGVTIELNFSAPTDQQTPISPAPKRA